MAKNQQKTQKISKNTRKTTFFKKTILYARIDVVYQSLAFRNITRIVAIKHWHSLV